LWAELINSDWSDHLGSGRREDRLGNDVWLDRFLRGTVWRGQALPTSYERDRLRALRSLLRRMVDDLLGGRSPGSRDTDELNHLLANAPVLRRLEPEAGSWNLVLAPPRGSIDDVLGEIAAAFATMLAEDLSDRVKVCENPDCGWVILDTSRNRSRRWCDSAECGNLMKVRRFRQRRRLDRAGRGDSGA